MPNPGFEFSYWDSTTIPHDANSTVTFNFAGDQLLKAYFNVTDFAINAYPNPFNNTVNITYSLPESGQVSVTLYDMTGREMAEPVTSNVFTAQGSHTVQVDAEQLGLRHGVYMLVMRGSGKTITTRIIYTKNTN